MGVEGRGGEGRDRGRGRGVKLKGGEGRGGKRMKEGEGWGKIHARHPTVYSLYLSCKKPIEYTTTLLLCGRKV